MAEWKKTASVADHKAEELLTQLARRKEVSACRKYRMMSFPVFINASVVNVGANIPCRYDCRRSKKKDARVAFESSG